MKNSTRSEKILTRSYAAFVLAAMLAVFSFAARAQTPQPPCPLPLPPSVMFQVTFNNGFFCSSNGGSYFDVNIVVSGHYLGWCSDGFATINTSVQVNNPCFPQGYDQFYTGNVYDSFRASCPILDTNNIPNWVFLPDPSFTPDQCVWNEINYLLNHKIGTNPDAVQAAIWDLISPLDPAAFDTLPTFATNAPPNPQAQQDRSNMVAAAKANSSFIPGPGDVRAAILSVDENVQVVFVEVICPPCDTIPPVFTKTPTNMVLGCNPPSIPDCDLSQVTATDATPVTITCASSNSVNGCDHTRVITYTAVDTCGNTNTFVQTISWTEDTNAPAVTVPPGRDLGCNPKNTPTDSDIAALVSATDNCSVTSTNISHVDSQNGCQNTRTFTVTATDGCGNTSQAKTLIYTWTVDTTPPVIVCPGNVTNIAQKTYCSFTPGGWGAPPNGNNVALLLANNFSKVYPGGVVEIGIPGFAGFSLKFTSSTAIEIFIPSGGTPGPLKKDAVNPTDSAACEFASQVLALALNINFSDAGITTGTGILGDLTLNDPTSPLNGKTLRQILALANIALGGGNAGVSISTLMPLLTSINQGFDNCQPTSWAIAHLLPVIIGQNPGVATATDNCDPNPVITFTDITIPGCGGNSLTYRIWKATDACGNSNTCTQILATNACTNVFSIVVPTGGNLGCNPATLPTDDSVKALVKVTNACSVVTNTVTHVDSQSGCQTTRTFTIKSTDACGNIFATRTVVYSWTSDTTPPVLVCPGNVTNVVMAKYCSYTQGGWGAPPSGGNPGMILSNNFTKVYPGGVVEIGIPGSGGYSLKFTSANAITVYLPAGGTPAPLNADATNPTSTSSGVFGAQVLALQLNVDFGDAGIGKIGDLVLNDPTSPLNGKTVRQILALANIALGGGNAGVSISVLNPLIDSLNGSFDNCSPSGFAMTHLLPGNMTQTPGVATATDNCDPHPIVTYHDVTVAGSCAGSTITYRTWTAKDACGNSNTCTQIIVTNACTTTNIVVPCPTGLNCSGKSNCVNLSWSPCSGVSSYTLKRCSTKTGTYVVIQSGLTTTNCSDLTVTNGNCYYYVVCAVKSGVSGADCAPVCAIPCAPLPSPWNSADIGAVGATGAASYTAGKFTVDGSGVDIWGTADEFRYVYQVASGDCSVVARVTGIQKTDGWAKAGVMIRETLTAGSKQASMFLTVSNGVSFQNRATTSGSSASVTTAGPVAPYWVKIVRSGGTIYGYASSNGFTWTPIGSQAITMNSTVYIGLAVTSHNDGVINMATFDNVTATP